jgi:hypothetical protein
MLSAGAHGAARSAWIEINRPLTSLALSQPATNPQVATAASTGLTIGPVSLPIGMDIKSITCNEQDIDDGWGLVNFTFGTLNLVNPQGQGTLNLSMFSPFLEHVDRLAPWILSKTKVDVQVTAQLYNQVYKYQTGAAPATGTFVAAFFKGFSLNAFQEEQVCAIQTRIEPTDRNVGNAELINHFRTTVGAGLGLHLPSYVQTNTQSGRMPLMTPGSFGMTQVPSFAQQIGPQFQNR